MQPSNEKIVAGNKWVITVPGGLINLKNFQEKDFKPDHVIRSLACQPRYNGLTDPIYTVADHTVNLCFAVWNTTHSMRLTLLACLHDFPEAYVGDVVSTVKSNKQRRVEKRILFTIELSHGLAIQSEEILFIHSMDKAIRATEMEKVYQSCKITGHWPRLETPIYVSPSFDDGEENLMNLYNGLLNDTLFFPKELLEWKRNDDALGA